MVFKLFTVLKVRDSKLLETKSGMVLLRGKKREIVKEYGSNFA